MLNQLTGQPALVAPTECQIGENPLWHPEAGIVFFLDISAGTILAYTPATCECRPFSRGPFTGGMVLQEDGTLLLFQDGCISVLGLDGVQREVASGLCPSNERFNDVIADPDGRVFAGALGGSGRLFRVDTDGTVTELLNGFGIPNGMGFTRDGKGMYLTDSKLGRLYLFDYDRATGTLSNRRIFAEIPREEGLPDGMTTDAEGYVWTALWFGGCLKRFAPDGTLERSAHFPVTQTTALCFAGPDLGEIYVTSAASSVSDSMMPPGYNKNAARGSGLYRLRIGDIRGRPLFRSRINFGR